MRQPPTKGQNLPSFPQNGTEQPSEKVSIETHNGESVPRSKLLIPKWVNSVQETVSPVWVGKPRETGEKQTTSFKNPTTQTNQNSLAHFLNPNQTALLTIKGSHLAEM
jgi:hypothetical protein